MFTWLAATSGCERQQRCALLALPVSSGVTGTGAYTSLHTSLSTQHCFHVFICDITELTCVAQTLIICVLFSFLALFCILLANSLSAHCSV